MNILKEYGDTEGPLGFPMKDEQAKALDEVLRAHPEHEYQRLTIKAGTDLLAGERADVSWISTETIDRYGEIVLAAGFRDDIFKANPVVTINHDYTRCPIGRSAWRMRLKENDKKGVKAKTIYPARPDEWPDEIWPSDAAWSLVKSGLMGGKSVGFLTLRAHQPTEDEIKKRPELSKVRRIVDEWQLVEYSCCWMPVNPETVVEATAKALIRPEDLKAFGIEIPSPTPFKVPVQTHDPYFPHTPLSEVTKAIRREVEALDIGAIVKKAIEESYLKARGVV